MRERPGRVQVCTAGSSPRDYQPERRLSGLG
jgi:hypothetical protein